MSAADAGHCQTEHLQVSSPCGLGFLTAWWPQGNWTSHMEAQDFLHHVPANRVGAKSPLLAESQKLYGVISPVHCIGYE